MNGATARGTCSLRDKPQIEVLVFVFMDGFCFRNLPFNRINNERGRDRSVAEVILVLRRHPYCCPLKHCWYWTTGLDHPNLSAVPLDEYVKACACGKCERARTVCFDRIGPRRSAGLDNDAIYADRGEWTDQRTISIEINAFYDGFRLRNTTDDVPSVRGEYIRAVQSLHAATLHRAVRPRGAGHAERHRYGGQGDQRRREQ